MMPLQLETRQKVTDAAQRYKVPTDLAQAVNFIESGYGINTGPSSAGALGPMQFMPETAATVARDHNRQFGTKWTQEDVLRNSDINISAGAYHLRQLLDRSGGDEDKALFGYNPSSKYVRSVQQQRQAERQLGSGSKSSKGSQSMAPVPTTGEELFEGGLSIGRGGSLPQTTPLPFAPLVPNNMPLSTVNSNDMIFPTVEQNVDQSMQQQEPAVYQSPQQQQAALQSQQQTAAVRAKMKSAEGGGIGIGHKILATLAALSGNFGPAIALREQERKTKVYGQIAAPLAEVNRLKRDGKYQEATELATQIFTNFGDRAPEIGQYIQPLINKLDTEQAALRDAKVLVKGYDKAIPKDSPRRAAFDVIKTAVNAGTPAGLAMLKDFGDKFLNVKMQYTPKGMTASTEVGGLESTEVLPEPFDAGMLKGIAGKKLQTITGLTEDQLTNLMNNKPALNAQGQNITSPQNIARVKQLYSQLQEQEVQIDLAAKAPLEPTINLELNRQGYSNDQIARRDIPGSAWEKAYTSSQTRQESITAGALMANMRLPSVAQIKEPIVIDNRTGRKAPGLSLQQALANPDNYSVHSAKDAGQVTELFMLRDRLSLLAQVIGQLPSIDDPLGRVAFYADEAVNKRVGFNAQTTGRQALQTIVQGDIERYVNSNNIGAIRYKRLTDALVSGTASQETATATLQELNRVLQSDYDILVRQGAISNTPGDFGVKMPQQPAKQPINRRPIP